MELKHANAGSIRRKKILLIVPYGIETRESPLKKRELNLLIVPYGIETDTVGRRKLAIQTFNRTLWN